MYRQGSIALALVFVFSASGIMAAKAQVDPDLSPLIAPIQPEPRLGLPSQAPNILPVAEPPAVTSPRPASPAPQPSGQQERQAASPSATTRPEATGSWETECTESSTAPGGCQAIVRAAIGDQLALVLAVAGEVGDARLQMALPLGFSLKHPVRIKLGEFETEFSVSRCTAQGCLIEEGASSDFLDALARSAEPGDVVMANADGDQIVLPLPVAGADEAIAAALAAQPSQ